ncbi:MAG: alpha/beta hydrolase family esterase [Bacteroidota bacterium]
MRVNNFKSISLFILFNIFSWLTAFGQVVNDSILVDGNYRTFHFQKPAPSSSPQHIIFILHGSGGNGMQMFREASSLQTIADRERILLVYPDGYKHFWNECRKAATSDANLENINEQTFFLSMIRRLSLTFGTDTNTAFALGFSGGGHMSYKLALTLPDKFKAITAVVANLPDSVNMDCTESGIPVSVMIVNGTADGVNPYNGGEVKVSNVKLGTVRSTEQTFRYWSSLAGYSGEPRKEALPDTIKTDSVSIERYSYRSAGRPEVNLVKVINGTHSFPPGFDIFLEGWSFFKRQLAVLR